MSFINKHYTVTIRDLSTIVVTAHFIDNEEGFIPTVGAAHMTINLTTPLSIIDDSFLSAEENQGYEPCDISEFYANSDDETNRAIMIAEGKDPDVEMAKWASDNAAYDEKERLWFQGYWIPVEERLPHEQDRVLVCSTNSSTAVIATRFNGAWVFDSHGRDETTKVTFWAPAPICPEVPF